MNDIIRSTLQALLAGLVLFAAVAWLSGGCAERIEPVDLPARAVGPIDPAGSFVVEERETPLFEQASGTVSSARHTTISSSILARIDAIPVRAGDEVALGAVLVRLDGRDLEARLQAAREEVSSARAALELASSERDRIRGLYASRVASRQQLDRANASHRMATAELERAEQRVADAEVGLSHSEIHSPVAGRVIDRLAEPGDTAAPGAPLLRIYDPSAMRLEVPVREGLATRLRPGEALDVLIAALDLQFEGRIDEIVPAAAPGARTFLVKVRLPPEPRLYAGMFGRASIPAGRGLRLVAPTAAIERIGQLEYVTVLEAERSPARRLVTSGSMLGDAEIEVLSGLAAGERVALH